MRTIVSLTSTAHRLPIARHTLISLLEQSTPADEVRINLSREAYLLDDGVDSVPSWLEAFVSSGAVTLHWSENTGPYRKLLPTLRDCADDDLVVTCDDDVIYGDQWLAKLIEHAKGHPDAIVCGHARVPIRNVFGGVQSYVHWPRVFDDLEHEDPLPIGVAGVVYRKRLIDLDFLDWRAFLEVAPRQDDLWFRMASLRMGTPITIAPSADSEVHPIRVPGALSETNVAARRVHGWQRFAGHALRRATFRLKAYLGVAVCDNDRVWRAVQRASAEFESGNAPIA